LLGQRRGQLIPTSIPVLGVLALVGVGGLPQHLGDLGVCAAALDLPGGAYAEAVDVQQHAQ
jgi:hypothetical protein